MTRSRPSTEEILRFQTSLLRLCMAPREERSPEKDLQEAQELEQLVAVVQATSGGRRRKTL